MTIFVKCIFDAIKTRNTGCLMIVWAEISFLLCFFMIFFYLLRLSLIFKNIRIR